ncbi:MAG: UDP-N-acetylmuramate--L-alanine ligase [Hyphomicrobiales bacterium]|nr:UDP-N-acetylmuramate--L-alanine ligase [Hyphomicrobiales bacterium]
MRLPHDIGTVHVIGIGGIGMSAIAEVLAAQGYAVQGSDQKDSANCARLRARGMKVFVGHDARNLDGASLVVMSTAVKDDNPELADARARGLPVIRRAEMLAEIMRLFATISVTGTHGKTTTTSLISHLLADTGQDPTVITGGIILDWGSNARLGKGPWMVVEADESDGTFVRIPTQIGIVTNVDPEHLDYFGTVANMHREFGQFLTQIPFYGLAVVCIEHPVARALVERLSLRRDGRRLLTYGESADADLRLTGTSVAGRVTTFSAVLSDRVRGGRRTIEGWQVPVPGHHNALNALAAIAAATEIGVEDAALKSAMARFAGVKRRYQPTGSWNGAAIFDDYGHHPVEIAAVLKAARAGAAGGRVIAICEPHRYTRVRDLFEEFSRCFADADSVIIGPLYAAGEPAIAGISHGALAAAITAGGHRDAISVDAARDLVPAIKSRARSGDTILCFGAGNATDWAHALPQWLAE